MGLTKIDELNANSTKLKRVSSLPQTPQDFWGMGTNDVIAAEWVGGESVLNIADDKMYVQTATSGSTPTWRRFVDALVTF